MGKEKFFVLHQEISSVGVSESKVVNEMPAEIQEGWVATELEVEKNGRS
jgi:hypothetical protein